MIELDNGELEYIEKHAEEYEVLLPYLTVKEDVAETEEEKIPLHAYGLSQGLRLKDISNAIIYFLYYRVGVKRNGDEIHFNITSHFGYKASVTNDNLMTICMNLHCFGKDYDLYFTFNRKGLLCNDEKTQANRALWFLEDKCVSLWLQDIIYKKENYIKLEWGINDKKHTLPLLLNEIVTRRNAIRVDIYDIGLIYKNNNLYVDRIRFDIY